MKFLFIVQGEGRGHFTQAIALEEMLRRNGHEVVEVLVGKSSKRVLPGFFSRSIQAPTKHFLSPNFLPTAENKRVHLTKSFFYNLVRIPEYFHSMRYIHQRIEATKAEVVINFYELLTGLTYALFRPSVPCICIGHQYLFLHKDFEFPHKSSIQLVMLRLFTRLTSLRATQRLALSFRKMSIDVGHRITVVPPLLRKEISAVVPENGDYIHGYLLNAGFSDSVEAFHAAHPEISLHFFWDKTEVEEETKIDDTLTFHQIDDVKFLYSMAGCRAYATTAGFESICEAMFLGKPVLMVPAHIEQDCNAHDAFRSGAGIIGDSFALEPLLKYVVDGQLFNNEFHSWACSSERLLVNELEKLNRQEVIAKELFSAKDFSSVKRTGVLLR